MIKPIQTEYKGYLFRSRLEARWAVFFDAVEIKYEYEPEGFKLSDGTMYLPDFYLSESKSFFEVKGVMTGVDMHKIKAFVAEAGIPVTIGYSDFTFQACDNWTYEGDAVGSYTIADKEWSVLAECRECGKKWFMGTNGFWDCQCCNHYDGDCGFKSLCNGDWCCRYSDADKDVETAIKRAKQARFEHGETPITTCGCGI